MAAELVRDLGPVFVAAWRSLVDAHGPKDAARIFAKVLGHIETRDIEAVAVTLEAALKNSEPLLLALAPPLTAAVAVAHESLSPNLRAAEIEAGRACHYDRKAISLSLTARNARRGTRQHYLELMK